MKSESTSIICQHCRWQQREFCLKPFRLIDETAEILHTSAATVKRDWKFSRAWLLNEIRGATQN